MTTETDIFTDLTSKFSSQRALVVINKAFKTELKL